MIDMTNIINAALNQAIATAVEAAVKNLADDISAIKDRVLALEQRTMSDDAVVTIVENTITKHPALLAVLDDTRELLNTVVSLERQVATLNDSRFGELSPDQVSEIEDIARGIAEDVAVKEDILMTEEFASAVREVIRDCL